MRHKAAALPVLALVAAMSLAACAIPATPSQGAGFALAPPAGADWIAAGAAPGRIVYTHRAGVPARARGLTPYTLTAGAAVVADERLAAGLPGAARAWLAQRLRAPGRDDLERAVAPATLHGARCAAYTASQVDHYEAGRILPDHVDDRSQYVQHGMLCAHPGRPGTVVQVFFNEQFLRDGEPVRRVGEADWRAFFDGVRW